MHVYTAITAITDALSKEGIAKGRKNAQQGYAFRGIDDIYNALATELAKNNLCVLPRVLERGCEERQTKSGGTLFYVTVRAAFDFVSALDGSTHEIVTFGEAMDSGDKATNKAMSAAYKYAALMAFCIPTEGDNDTENATHEIAPAPTDLKSRAGAFRSHLGKLKTELAVTNLVTSNNKLLQELREKLPAEYDDLSQYINRVQDGFRTAKAS
jgi:hypothetical protein